MCNITTTPARPRVTRDRCPDGLRLWAEIDEALAAPEHERETVYQAVRAYYRHVAECCKCGEEVERGEE